MCGRYTLAVPEGALIETFDVPGLTFAYRPRYNIAPGQPCPVVAEDRDGRRMGLLDWGLIPSWKDEASGGFINARAETVTRKASFREAFHRRRCLVPADGFYEWRRATGGKVPFWIHPAGGGLVSFAAIWESWSRPGSDPKHTFAILTTDANQEVSEVHDRMPVVIAEEHREGWLNRATEPGRLRGMLVPAADGTFALRRVSTRVNRPSEDGPGLLEPADDGEAG